MSEQILNAVIPFVMGAIGTTVGGYFIIKKVKSQAGNIVLDLIDEITPELPKLLAKEEVRQFVYSLGVLAGNGAKSGVGLGTKGGKFKFEDLLLMGAQAILPQIVQKVGGAIVEGSQGQEQPQQQEGKW